MYRITIVVPVYKVESYISNTMQSLAHQITKNFDVILVDDGTPDKSIDIAIPILREAGIRYNVIHQKNQGPGIARNVGVTNCSSEWVLFLDSDDTIQPFATEVYGKIIEENPAADVIFSGYQTVEENCAFKPAVLDSTYKVFSRKQLLHGFLTRKQVFLVPGTLYRVAFLKKHMVEHPPIRWSEDQYFMWLVLDKLQNAPCTNAILYNYVHHSGESIMRSALVERMIDAFDYYAELPQKLMDPEVKLYLLPRWCVGCLHVLGTRKNKTAFEHFWETVDMKKMCRTLLSFPSQSVRMLAIAGLINKWLLYGVFSKHMR